MFRNSELFTSEFAKKHRGEGIAVGGTRAILIVLKARGLSVTTEQQDRIESCRDGAMLDQWIERAATVPSVDELFE